MTDQPNTERCDGSGKIKIQGKPTDAFTYRLELCPGCDHPDCPNRVEPDPPKQERVCGCGKAHGSDTACDGPGLFHSPLTGDEGEAVRTMYVDPRFEAERAAAKASQEALVKEISRAEQAEAALDRAIEERDEARSGIKGRNAVIDKLTADLDAAIERAEAAKRDADYLAQSNIRIAADRDQARSSLTTLQGRVREALNELGVPDEAYPAPVTTAVFILTQALEEES